MIPRMRNVLATAPDRTALLECAAAIYVSAFASGVTTALTQRGMPPLVAAGIARETAGTLIADPLAVAELEDGLTAALSGIQPSDSQFLRRGPL